MILRRLLLATLVAICLLVVLQGCAANAEGWKDEPTAKPLPAVFVYVDREWPGRICRANGNVYGCAVRDYAANECRIYIERGAPAWQKSHEMFHCAGYSHQ